MNAVANRNVRLIVIDVDRTLLTTERVVLPRVSEALRAARDVGTRVVLATARSPRGVSHVMNALSLTGPAICFGGSWIGQVHATDPLSAEGISDQRLRREDVEAACRLAVQWGVDLSWHSTEAWRIPGWNDAFRHDHEVTREVPEMVESYLDLTELPHKLMFIAPPTQEPTLETIRAQLAPTTNALFSHHRLLEINALGVSKGTALRALQAQLGVSPEETVAIGDSYNDVPMFEAAGYAIAMGNGVDAVKGIANWVTTTNDEGGVADAIQHLVETCRLPRA
ncbi:Cof-type HAD-IIB family hydrolase [Paraburkholderia sp. HD33-4]|uniref:Cof-type HAD-IIB family hydrolase n=1 Tax=Paraburkholderia sp. HD33-4 TaxID=2883242 RepID=UPI001F25CB92|nr:Cof-type HAD-IIB family hydrolase [Paraburkholderia sp. HD33-4]